VDLVEISAGSGVTRVPVRTDVVRIGRAMDNEVVLSDQPAASRYHAELRRDDEDHWRVRDCDSRNGTWIDGNRLTGEAPFPRGSVLGIGDTTIRVIDAPAAGATVEGVAQADLYLQAQLLSAREREVIALVAQGRTDDQVARELFISVKTVHSHLDRIRDKTGLRRRAELTRLAVRLGLPASAPRAT
jgi:DNA-binding CsgD family transcriptional regulator